MSEATPTGPSGTADWATKQIGAGPGQPLSVLLLPDAGNRPGVNLYHTVLSAPALARDSAGEPVFALTLVLLRQPNPDEQNIFPLIQEGIFSLETTLALPAGAIERLEEDYPDDTFQPLFARQGNLLLVAKEAQGAERILAQAETSGNALRAAFSTNLTRDETLDVLSALDGVKSSLCLRAEISFRSVAAARTIRIACAWADVYDFLYRRMQPEGEIQRAWLRTLFQEMLTVGVLSAYEVQERGQEQPLSGPNPEVLFDWFMRQSSVLLERKTLDLPVSNDDNRYELRERPHPMFMLDHTEKASGTALRSLALEADLEEVLGGALAGRDRSRFIHLVSPGNSSGVMSPVPRRLRTGRATSGGAQVVGAVQMTLGKGSAVTISSALQPSDRPAAANTLINSDLVVGGRRVEEGFSWWLDDLLISCSDIRSLPVVENPNGVTWPDRIDRQMWWCRPVFQVVQPAPNGDPTTSPFLFSFRRTGTTSTGEPALVASVRLTLAKRVHPEVLASVEEANAELPPLQHYYLQIVPTDDLAVSLYLPFVDESDGKTRLHAFTGQVSESGDNITVTVDLLDDWVRLCYGALAYPRFQSLSADLQVAYTFEAYVPVNESDLALASGGKYAALPILYSEAEEARSGSQPHFDAIEGVYRHPMGEIMFKREPDANGYQPASAPRTRRAQPRNAAGRFVAVARLRPLETTPVVTTAHPVVVSRPELRTGPVLVDDTGYATRSLVRQDSLPVLFPCRELGAFYRDATSGNDRAIGCQDALQLGRTVYRQYEEIPELAGNGVRVFRSLQQPGRFLVLPDEYRITRYEANVSGRAYQPTMILYSVLDPEVEANNRIVFRAALQAHHPPFARRALLTELQQRAAQPVVEYPTAIVADVDYAWTVDRTITVEASAICTPDSFQVSLATDIPGALQLRAILENSGLYGSVTFQLPDGTPLRSTLLLDLRNLTGPWETGPLEVVRQGGSATLTNKINNSVEVEDLLVYPETGTPLRIPVEATITPAASRTVALGGAEGNLVPQYTVPAGIPAHLEEIRNVVEDVHTNVIFIDLINYDNHNLSRLEIRARLKGFGDEHSISMSGDPPRGALDLVLPLTMYLEKHILEFQVSKHLRSGETAVTPWLEWDLRENGNIISLSWEMIQ